MRSIIFESVMPNGTLPHRASRSKMHADSPVLALPTDMDGLAPRILVLVPGRLGVTSPDATTIANNTHALPCSLVCPVKCMDSVHVWAQCILKPLRS